MLNIKKIINIFNKFETLYRETNGLKKMYKVLLRHFTEKDQLPINDLNLKIGIDIDEEVNWKDNFKDMRIYENFFSSIKQNKINFQTGKIYCKKL